MPMMAMLDGEPVSAVELDLEQWTALRANYRSRTLTMTCGRRAIPKLSKLGLRFFAHSAGDDCGLHSSGAETAEHQQAKCILARSGERSGWKATIEACAPDRSWIADVLLERDAKRVAVEVQWSPQSEHEFARRTSRYLADDVECRWFLGPANHRRDLEGTYRLTGELNDLRLAVPGLLGEPHDDLPLDDAAHRLFSGQIRRSVELHAQSLHIDYLMRRCWRTECGEWYARWFVTGVDAVSRCGRPVRVDLEEGANPAWRPHATSRPESWLQDQLRPLLRDHMVEPVRYAWRKTRPVPEGYVGAICARCGVVQGDGLERDGDRAMVTVPWSYPFRWSDDFLKARAHLCPDVGNGHCAPPSAVGTDLSAYPPGDVWVNVVPLSADTAHP